ncbi:FxsA family protein [Lentibacillus amyloliquefaciens]|uniref:Exlusion protein FxsA n=1 Tax=Lentibacillus amyloliquefaciens TaxID=1472767 RepID=A0A0U4EYG0_9BACI|nr:FxsA family protein [Lentibacillus amyloliquefaciens]ALX48343.1 exlusion protein FxsA [Lentibacillus amyloliquefaciens]
MRWLLLGLIIIPAIEIGVFIWAGGIIGPWWVVALIIFTGVAGVSLARKEGFEAWKRAQNAINNGQPPGWALMDGICIFIGGVMLFAPGFITDIIGFILVLPFTRGPFKRMIEKYLRKRADRNMIIYRR